jgi:hypothetical protein
MPDRNEYEAILRGGQLKPIEGGRSRERERHREKESEEESCPAFGYLRGLHERAEAVRFCFRNGNSLCLAYSWMGGWEHNPSVGLLLKFSGDVVTLVTIRGSNLDGGVNGADINLTDRGLQRHRITWVREMDDDELRRAGKDEPTVDAIDAAAFDSLDKLRQWVSQRAPAFLGGALAPG